jgi:hypothetical protein
MELDLHAFARLRPYLYHVTALENLTSVRRTRRLEPAAAIMRRAGRGDLVRWRRPFPVTLLCDGETIVLKDQALLIEEQVSLFRDWSFADFVEYMNDHVFFWPGTDRGPVKSGVELPYHESGTASVTLRIPFDDVLAANPTALPLFCSVNSGAQREQGSRRVSRGPRLFRSALAFSRRPSDVVEVAFRSAVTLSASMTVSRGSEWARI